MAKLIGAAIGFVLVILLQCAAAQTVHVVGDSIGWTIPSNGAAAYTTWATGKNFAVGDILTFNFATNRHDVLQVPKASYDACSDSNPIGNVITTGPVNITLETTGDHYYICTFSSHCQAGQKLAISVSSAGAPTSSPTPTPTPTTPITPSPANNVPAVDCPTEAPTAGGPSSTGTPKSSPAPPATPPTPITPSPTNNVPAADCPTEAPITSPPPAVGVTPSSLSPASAPDSSSSKVLAGAALSVMAVVMGFLF